VDVGIDEHLPHQEASTFFSVRADGIVELRRGSASHVQLLLLRAGEVATLWRLELQRNPNLIAALRTHPDAPYRFMIDVLDALKTAGAPRISLQSW
jgi:biopolymer transport protein ExbD